MKDLFDELRESEMTDLAAIDRATQIRLRKLMAHPNCRNPNHPGYDRYNEEKQEDKLKTHNTNQQ